MAYYLPSSGTADGGQANQSTESLSVEIVQIDDLRVFWGPEICRIEYLMHLMETGRIHTEDEETL